MAFAPPSGVGLARGPTTAMIAPFRPLDEAVVQGTSVGSAIRALWGIRPLGHGLVCLRALARACNG
jgi:hypothetical protein